MVSTGRHHGFESLAEQRVLLALDFAGNLVEVLAQPFELRFAALRAAWRSGRRYWAELAQRHHRTAPHDLLVEIDGIL
jgi:hypothetical protein